MSPTPVWAAERETDIDRAVDLLHRAFPSLAGEAVVPLAEGWDNAVFLVGDRWTLRVPRRAIALDGIRREIAVLPEITPLLPLPIPVPELVATDLDPDDPWPVTVAGMIPGRELAEAGLSSAELVPAGAAIGDFLHVLHASSTRAVAAATTDLRVDPMQRGWPRPRRAEVHDALRQLVTDDIWTGDSAVHDLVDEAASLDAPTETVLVHGDLHIRHVLIGDDRSAAGVIDWGDLCLGDPAVDLALAYSGFDGIARRALLTAYGPVSAECELRSRALAVRLSAVLADYAARDGRPALLAEALSGFARAVA